MNKPKQSPSQNRVQEYPEFSEVLASLTVKKNEGSMSLDARKIPKTARLIIYTKNKSMTDVLIGPILYSSNICSKIVLRYKGNESVVYEGEEEETESRGIKNQSDDTGADICYDKNVNLHEDDLEDYFTEARGGRKKGEYEAGTANEESKNIYKSHVRMNSEGSMSTSEEIWLSDNNSVKFTRKAIIYNHDGNMVSETYEDNDRVGRHIWDNDGKLLASWFRNTDASAYSENLQITYKNNKPVGYHKIINQKGVETRTSVRFHFDETEKLIIDDWKEEPEKDYGSEQNRERVIREDVKNVLSLKGQDYYGNDDKQYPPPSVIMEEKNKDCLTIVDAES